MIDREMSPEEQELLLHLVEDVDSKLMEWVTSNKIGALPVFGVVLGRITTACIELNLMDDYNRLLDSVKDSLNTPNQNNNPLH
jgi:hypothetical protein